jgi:hypothetical protein
MVEVHSEAKLEAVGVKLYPEKKKSQKKGPKRRRTSKTNRDAKSKGPRKRKRSRRPPKKDIEPHVQSNAIIEAGQSSVGTDHSANASESDGSAFMDLLELAQDFIDEQGDEPKPQNLVSTPLHPDRELGGRSALLAIQSSRNSVPFHIVSPAEPGSSTTGQGQFLGKPSLAGPFAGPYRLAWTDPSDGLEVQMNSVATAVSKGFEPLSAEWSKDQVVARNLALDAKGHLTQESVALLKASANLIPTRARPAAAQKKRKVPTNSGNASKRRRRTLSPSPAQEIVEPSDKSSDQWYNWRFDQLRQTGVSAKTAMDLAEAERISHTPTTRGRRSKSTRQPLNEN